MGSALGQCDLKTKTCEFLYQLPGLVYTMDVFERAENDGWVASGGDDGVVRVWKLTDFSLVREFPAPRGVPQGVALAPDDHRVVFSVSGSESPTEILVGDFVSGQVKSLLKIPRPFVRVARAAAGFIYNQPQKLILADASTGDTKREFQLSSSVENFATSLNGEWLAAADKTGTLYCFEIKTGRLLATSREKIENVSTIAVTNDGQNVFTTEWKAALQQWDTGRNSLKEIASIRGQARSLSVSPDGERIAVGGNHRDLAIYESKTGNRIAYLQTAASDFYVTNAWVHGQHLVFTTDSGVLFAGTLEP
jgi:WD40 repeat protein